jgi:hypothetical protein
MRDGRWGRGLSVGLGSRSGVNGFSAKRHGESVGARVEGCKWSC